MSNLLVLEEQPKKEVIDETERGVIRSLDRLQEMVNNSPPIFISGGRHDRTYGLTGTLLGAGSFNNNGSSMMRTNTKKPMNDKWKSKITSMLEKIAPRWSKKIANAEDDLSTLHAMVPLSRTPDSLDIGHYRYCIVGEAFGFDDEYRNTCDKCYNYSERISHYALYNETRNFVYNVNKFVDHFEAVHYNPPIASLE